MAQQTFSYGTNITLTATSYSGYAFIGWASGTTKSIISSTNTFNTIINSDKRIKAVFRPTTVKFNIINATTGAIINDNNLTISMNGVSQQIVRDGNYYVLYNCPSTMLITITCPNFSTYEVSWTPEALNENNIALSPIGKWVAYTQWTHSVIEDVDTHVIIYDSNMSREKEIFYSDKSYTNSAFSITLDIDDTGAGTGETISIEVKDENLFSGYTFYYVLYNYGNTRTGSGARPKLPDGSYTPMSRFGIQTTVGSSVISPTQDDTQGFYYHVFTMKNRVINIENIVTTDNSGYWQLQQGLH